MSRILPAMPQRPISGAPTKTEFLAEEHHDPCEECGGKVKRRMNESRTAYIESTTNFARRKGCCAVCSRAIATRNATGKRFVYRCPDDWTAITEEMPRMDFSGHNLRFKPVIYTPMSRPDLALASGMGCSAALCVEETVVR